MVSLACSFHNLNQSYDSAGVINIFAPAEVLWGSWLPVQSIICVCLVVVSTVNAMFFGAIDTEMAAALALLIKPGRLVTFYLATA